MQLDSVNTQPLGPCCIGSVFYCFIDKLRTVKQVEAFWDAGSDALALADVDAFFLFFFFSDTALGHTGLGVAHKLQKTNKQRQTQSNKNAF